MLWWSTATASSSTSQPSGLQGAACKRDCTRLLPAVVVRLWCIASIGASISGRGAAAFVIWVLAVLP
jgi:hypothetical protein